MSVEFQRLDVTGQFLPRVSATVDGEKVAWRKREAGPRGPAFTGWICSEHGKGRCEHTEDVEALLTADARRRLLRHEGFWA